MNIKGIIYNGIDNNEIKNYVFIKDILINREIELESNIESIYKISIEVKRFFNGTKDIVTGINIENEKLNGLLGDFTLNIKCRIEYLREDSSLDIKEFVFINQEYIELPYKVSNEKIKGKVRNIYVNINTGNYIYLSIYYVLAI